MKLLIVEDEPELAKNMSNFLSSELYICELAADYETALDKVHLFDYACIILDINLPDGNGLRLLDYLKKKNRNDGVLIISARNSLDDKIEGLRSGADDYLVKPFHLPELSARVEAIIRRKFFNGSNQIKIENLTIDLQDRVIRYEGNPISLTKKEYELLIYFASNKNRVVTKEAIAEHLWGDEVDVAGSYDFIYTHIKNLRKKLTNSGCPDYLEAVYGMGYKFKV